jgi:hypothetical protein
VYPRAEEGLDSKPHGGQAGERGEVERSNKNEWDRGRFGKDQLRDTHSV